MVRVAFFNANGLAGKDPDILEFNQRQDIDVFCILETWNTTGKSAVISNHFINLTKTNPNLTIGGRRSTGGILCFAKPTFKGLFSTLYTDPELDFVIFEFQEVVFCVAYLPPSAPDTKLAHVLDKCQEIAGNRPFFAFGDFNARTRQANDHNSNQRGHLLDDYLLENPVFLWPAESGRYSSFSPRGDGCGVPDLVLSNGEEPRLVTIHEKYSLGGSDHRPVTFDITCISLDLAETRDFNRFNIRRLHEPDILERYKSTLANNLEAVLHQLEASDDVEHSWSLVKSYITNAASESCGYLRYQTTSYGEFFTPQLEFFRQRLALAEIRMEQFRNCGDIALRRATQIGHSTAIRNYREAISERKSELFQEVANRISQPGQVASLQKMIKCKETRSSRKGCALKKDDIELHARHFSSTFGQNPEGRIDGPTPSGIYVAKRVTTVQVEFILASLTLGKAAGVDGFMPELFNFGKRYVAQVLSVLFNLIYAQSVVPKDWREALVVPVYKNKGSDQDASNYRPISLTSICRRVFERLLLQDLQENIQLLSDTQGGFRKNRSTLDLCFALEEVMLANPNASFAFLDIRAAFDTVNRDILWARLFNEYGVSFSMIQMLRALFDHNVAYLVIGGKRSSAIPILRGLMQGSSLSPILFSFFIDPLLKELNQQRNRKLLVGNVKSNHFAFADDLELHARDSRNLQPLLDICGNWSEVNGMLFQPQKCAVLGESDQPDSGLTIYNTPLALKAMVDYLGLPFTLNRINHEANVEKRCAKARTVAASLARHGMNLAGFPQYASAILYKTFIRPVMEYGLQLRVLAGKNAEKLQKTQNFAMRLIFSAHRTTSVNAMQKLLLLEPMRIRNQVINIKFAARLHNSNDSARPPVLIWRHAFPLEKPGSTARYTRANPLFPEATFLPIFNRRLIRHATMVTPAFKKEVLKKLLWTKIAALDLGNTNVAGTIRMDPHQQGHRHVLRPYAFSNPRIRVPILRWLVGNVAAHRPCQTENCNAEISRRHAVECSGAEEGLMELYPWLVPAFVPEVDGTFIDYLLNRFAHAYKEQDRPQELLLNISSAISAIYFRCLGYQQRENGFHVPRPANSQDSQQSSVYLEEMQDGEPHDPG